MDASAESRRAARPFLGRTLPSLLDETIRTHHNPRALRTRRDGVWEDLSIEQVRSHAERMAAGLLALGLERGDRVAFFLHSDSDFAVADMACLLAGLVDVPIYLTAPAEDVDHILADCGARALVVAEPELLADRLASLGRAPALEHVVLLEGDPEALGRGLPERVACHGREGLLRLGKSEIDRDRALPTRMRDALRPGDAATIIYTSGTTGTPKGVVLSHQNISYNVLAAFDGLEDLEPGPEGDVALSFLPLTHAYARTLHYGFLHRGICVCFVRPEELGAMLREVRPTVMATVPRVLEKLYERIVARGQALQGASKAVFNWALWLTGRYEVDRRPSGVDGAQLRLADRLVFSKWRAATGGRLRYVISGGAALSAHLVNAFGAAGITILQGYGLTETSPIIAFNRPGRNRAGTVGEPLPGLEVKIAQDGEILTRGPHVMLGYHGAADATRRVIDRDGWLHTGDIGEILPSGHIVITDRKKNLFKLSSGEYVTPQPLEERLMEAPFVERAVVVGRDRKFCAALLFLSKDDRRILARAHGRPRNTDWDALLADEAVVGAIQEQVRRANRGMAPWSTIKRFAILTEELSTENGMLTPTLKVRRNKLRQRYGEAIDALYDGGARTYEVPSASSDGAEAAG